MAKTKKHQLTNMALNEVSLVGAGMNPEAHVLLFKRRDTTTINSKEKDMTEAEKLAAAEKLAKEQKLAKEKEEAQEARLAKAEALASLNDAEKAYLKALPEAKQAEFLKTEAGKRADFIKANPLVVDDGESLTVGGATIKKSEVGAAMFAVIKSQQDQIAAASAVAKTATEALSLVSLEKEAETLWPNTPGTAAEKAAILKSIKTMPKEQSDVMLASLKGADAMHKERLTVRGHSGFQPVNAGDNTPQAELDTLVDAYIKSNPSVDKANATIAVLKANPALYTAIDQVSKQPMNRPN